MKAMMKRLSPPAMLMLLLAVFTLTTGFSCNDFERSTYNSLAASKAVIDQAAADYNAGTIARSSANHDAIERARNVHDAAVQAFHAYKVVKDAGADKAGLQRARDQVQAALNQLLAVQQSLEAIPRGNLKTSGLRLTPPAPPFSEPLRQEEEELTIGDFRFRLTDHALIA